MGCCASSGGGMASGPANNQKPLLEEYVVNEVLGEGAFGIVYACQKHGSSEPYAVKMVDKVDTPLAQIKTEANFLRKMDHPNVMKAYDVVYEKCFVCIVMDRLLGGDLIHGMQAYWKEHGKIPCHSSLHLVRQVAAAGEYLHEQNIVHRDIKSDNFLCDRKEILSLQCKLVLTDFGTAVEIQPGQRLKESCGTTLYWAPEFFRRDYSIKVDVWAMGVVVYGLLIGKFPFRPEPLDVMIKPVFIDKSYPQNCIDLVKSMLAKDEQKRLSSSEVIAHPWLSTESSVPDDSADMDPEQTEKDWSPQTFREHGANADVLERRMELVERLEDQHKRSMNSARSSGKSVSSKRSVKSGNFARFANKEATNDEPKVSEHYWKQWFCIRNRHAGNVTMKYEWWPMKRVDEEGILAVKNQTVRTDPSQKDGDEIIEKMLADHGIDTSKFGTGEAKSLEQLAAEINVGSAVLMLDASSHKKLVRVVDVVLLRIRSGGNQPKILVEVAEEYPDGRKREVHRLPGTKKEPHENARQTAERTIKEMVALQVFLEYSTDEVFEEEMDSPSYPGVRTVYRKHIIDGHVTNTSGKQVRKVGTNSSFDHMDNKNNVKYFCWMTEKQCEKMGVKYQAPVEEQEVSCLVHAPIGLNEDALREYLKQKNVDVSNFGTNGAVSLKNFAAELMRGETCLTTDNQGTVFRVADVVCIKLVHSNTGSLLIQTEKAEVASEGCPHGRTLQLKRLPGTKRRPDENQFVTARRIIKRELQISESHVIMDDQDIMVIEEEKQNPDYPGITTRYRKRIITAELVKPGKVVTLVAVDNNV